MMNEAYWENTTLSLILLKDTYVPNKDHDFVDDIVAHECNATGYVRKTIGSKLATPNNTFDWLDYTASIVGFGTLGGAINNTIQYGAIAEIKGGAASADPVSLIIKFVARTTPASYTVVWNVPIFRSAMG
ncbi:MAG: hypothetical protein HC814_02905 [Rhodobacteraceae bacterium]|nr:hypothetical protein [Paracoccaceae bacterium]